MSDRTTAALFDIDGTLVDSNFLHVDAWNLAFTELGLAVPSWKIQGSIGADGSELLARLIGDEPDDVKSKASESQSKHFQTLIPRLQLLPGARELVRAIADRGVRVVLATSAPQKELDSLLELLDLGDVLYAVTSAEDVEKAKPAPDIISIALQKAGVEASDAIMIGDAVWDVSAAASAGVDTIALRSGGTGASELRDVGATAVYDDAASLLDDLDASAAARLWA